MSDLLTTLTSIGFEPINLAISLILATIIGGIIVLIVVEIIGKKSGIHINPANAFVIVMVINLINYLGLALILASYIPFLPIWILQIAIWILLVKVLFHEISWVYSILIGVIGFAVTLIIVPLLVGMVSGYIPTF